MIDQLEAVFLDRDGTIGGTGRYIHPKDFTLFPNAAKALKLLKRSGVKTIAFTNQHRISRGEATIEEFRKQFREFGFDDAYICPHLENDGCDCRKPKPGMLLQAAADHRLNLGRCAVIGDVGTTDMLAAHAVGAIKVLVRTGWGTDSLTAYREAWLEAEPDYIAEDLLDAVIWLLDMNDMGGI